MEFRGGRLGIGGGEGEGVVVVVVLRYLQVCLREERLDNEIWEGGVHGEVFVM